jgi:hypothetical protein
MRGFDQTNDRTPGAFPMRRLRAIRISDAIRADLIIPGPIGTVASVHRSAINVRRGDRMLTFALAPVGGLPNGLIVASPIPLDRLGVRPGMAVDSDGSLSVSVAGVVIEVAAAPGWSPQMPALPQTSARERSRYVARATHLAVADAGAVGLGPLLLVLDGARNPLSSRLVEISAAALSDTLDGLQSGGVRRAATSASRLVGLGPGATPSGDDLLVGLCAGLLATGHPLARPFARQVADQAAGRTTALAETFLWHAGRGEFAERVQRTAGAILSGDEIGTQAAVWDALAWGATSGADLLVGVLVGITADAHHLPAQLRAASLGAAAA